MNVYFFDRISRERSEYDFNGKALPSPEAARQLAELIAMDLGVSEEGNWSSWAISVRDVFGKQIFSVPVYQPVADIASGLK